MQTTISEGGYDAYVARRPERIAAQNWRTAVGRDLDVIAARFGASRRVGEPDASLRAKVQAARTWGLWS